jgi:3-deoxy-manno-octulosonate cytidylyltransferase (CMP-KDO synthetase)
MPTKAIGIIPARYESTRLPGKPLLRETGKYLIQHVWEQASRAASLDAVVIATHDERHAQAAAAFGADTRMTAASHQTGTDRIAEVAAGIDCEIVVNIQGDEPEIESDAIDLAVRTLRETPDAVMSTLVCRTNDAARAADPNVVKAVTARDGRALRFSRTPIPCPREEDAGPSYLLHVGLYAYTRDFLLGYTTMPQTPLEKAEKLEQLRAVENGYRIQVAETKYEALGIDTPADYEAFVARYQARDR